MLAFALLIGCASGEHETTSVADQGATVPSQAVGKLPGQGAVGHDGQAMYQVPIDVPQGRAGLEPTLALSYGSQRSNDLLGVGWSLDGLSMVHRCPKLVGKDGTTAPVRYDSSDLYCVDGQRLRSTGGAYGAAETRYRTEPETFGEFASEGGDSAGPSHFWVRARDGRYLIYGNTADSRVDGAAQAAGPDGAPIALGTRRVAWLLREIHDRWNNTLTISYRQYPGGPNDLPHVVVERIQYTGVRFDPNGNRNVWFDYEDRPDPIIRYTGGMRERVGVRLKRIRTEAPRTVGGATQPVRSYELEYAQSTTTGRSLLAAVRMCDAAGTCLPATRFTYSQPPRNPSFTAVAQSEIRLDAGRLDAADFNHDGRDDLLYNRSGGGTAVRHALRDGDGAYAPELLGPGSTYWGRAVLGDVGADGIPEIVIAPAAGTGGTPDPDPLPDPEPDPEEPPPPPPNVFRVTETGFEAIGTHPVHSTAPLLADLDGDARIDELFVENGHWHYRSDSDGSAVDVHALAGAPLPTYANEYATTADLDGDGRAELLLPRAYSGSGIPWRLDRFTPNRVQQTGIEHTRCNVFADINGDGLKDVVSLYQGIHVQINAGNGLFLPRQPAWICQPGIPCGAPAFGMCDSGDPLTRWPSSYDHGLRVIDLDQDGREDVLVLAPGTTTFDMHAIALLARDDHKLQSINTSIRFRTLPTWPGETTPSFWGSASIAILDANADGRFDVAHIGERQTVVDGVVQNVRYLDVQLQESSNADLLQRVDADDWGSVHGFTYAPLRRATYRDTGGGCDYPVQCASASYPVVTNEQVSHGQYILDRFRHEYENLRINVRHEDALGFARHIVIDEAAGEERVLTAFDFTRELVNGRYRHPRAASPAATYRFAFLDTQRWHGQAQEVTTWDTRSTAYGASYFTRPTQTRLREWDAAEPFPPPMVPATIVADTTITSTTDAYGNEVHREVDRGGGYRDITDRVVRNDTVRWLLGLVEEERVTSVTPEGQQTREHHFTYDDTKGVLLTATREPNSTGAERTAQWLRTSFAYVRGVVYQTTQTDSLGRSRASTTTLDASESILPIRTTDALGHVTTLDWDPGLGVQTLVTDPNGVWIATDYDGFGRPRGTRGMDGSAATISYETFRPNTTTFYPLAVRTTTNTGATSIAYHDQRGLLVRQDALGADGVMRTTNADYDPAGRLIRRTRPYVAGGPVHNTWFGYDGADRPTYQFQFGTNGIETSSTVYTGLTTDHVDAEGRLRREVRDVAGHVVATSIFPAGSTGAPVTTTFAYGPFDNLVRTTDAAGNIVTLVHDRLGRSAVTIDADTGPRTTTYDAFGDVVAEIDALGAATTYEYDSLGRRLRRMAADGSDSWSWDTAPGSGIGRLHTKSRGSVSTTYGYDTLGRVATEAVTIQNKTYTFAQAYDDRGRPSRTTYPLAPGETSAFGVDRTYDATGNLASLHDARNGRAIWTRGTLTPAGELATESLGNGQLVSREFEPGTGRIKRISSTGGASWGHDLRYTYDRSGNITARTDAAQGLTESFGFDGADRLTSTSLGGQTRTFTYDVLGNRIGQLEHMPGCTASYGAGSAGPHAITAVECPSGASSTLTYDANGRLLNRTGSDPLTAIWTSFHKVSRLERAAGRIDFTYDADHRIVRKESQAPGTPAFGDLSGIWDDRIQLGLYEQRTSEQSRTVDHVYHVRLGGQTVASRIRSCPRTGACVEHWRYLHRDALGSVERTTDAAGNLAEAQSYAAFGTPRNASWTNASFTPPAFTRIGYTGHADLVETALVDMTGRLYDPKLHTFLSPDPIVQAPLYGPSWNRYSYVFNNPLRYVDPTGHVGVRHHFEMLLGPDLFSYAASGSFSNTSLTANAGMVAILGGLGAQEGGSASLMSQMTELFASGAREGGSGAIMTQIAELGAGGAYEGGLGGMVASHAIASGREAAIASAQKQLAKSVSDMVWAHREAMRARSAMPTLGDMFEAEFEEVLSAAAGTVALAGVIAEPLAGFIPLAQAMNQQRTASNRTNGLRLYKQELKERISMLVREERTAWKDYWRAVEELARLAP